MYLTLYYLHSRTSMEDSSHSTPSPMSSAASSQDSLHRGAMLNSNYPGYYTVGPGATSQAMKKKGVKSTLGRIFGKKDKQLKAAMKAAAAAGGGYVSGPMVNSPSGGFSTSSQMSHPAYGGMMGQMPPGMECDIPMSESMGGLGALAGKGDFDRRKKKK